MACSAANIPTRIARACANPTAAKCLFWLKGYSLSFFVPARVGRSVSHLRAQKCTHTHAPPSPASCLQLPTTVAMHQLSFLPSPSLPPPFSLMLAFWLPVVLTAITYIAIHARWATLTDHFLHHVSAELKTTKALGTERVYSSSHRPNDRRERLTQQSE